MTRSSLFASVSILAAAALAAGVVHAQQFEPSARTAKRPQPVCTVPPELARFEHPLTHVAARLAAREPVKIIAIGSSSTYGEGASSPAGSYPSRLEANLRQRFPGQRITVVNRGINGDDDRDKLDRFERDVVSQRPDAVLWQLGTNSMLNGDPMNTHLALLQDGVVHLRRATRSDVVLMDPQYAPKVINAGHADDVVNLIAEAARGTRVNLFRRFELMRRWREVQKMAFNQFLSSDELHMNDWSYSCVAGAIASAVAEAATRQAVPTASASPSAGTSGRE